MRNSRHLTSDDIWNRLWERIRSQIDAAGGLKRGRRSPPDGVPVDPNRPNTLSGGAAAPLEYDE